MTKVRDEKMLLEFGRHLARVRRRMGKTQRQLAYDSDIPISQVSRIDRGLVNPTLSTLYSIASSLRIPLKELVDWRIED